MSKPAAAAAAAETATAAAETAATDQKFAPTPAADRKSGAAAGKEVKYPWSSNVVVSISNADKLEYGILVPGASPLADPVPATSVDDDKTLMQRIAGAYRFDPYAVAYVLLVPGAKARAEAIVQANATFRAALTTLRVRARGLIKQIRALEDAADTEEHDAEWCMDRQDEEGARTHRARRDLIVKKIRALRERLARLRLAAY